MVFFTFKEVGCRSPRSALPRLCSSLKESHRSVHPIKSCHCYIAYTVSIFKCNLIPLPMRSIVNAVFVKNRGLRSCCNQLPCRRVARFAGQGPGQSRQRQRIAGFATTAPGYRFAACNWGHCPQVYDCAGGISRSWVCRLFVFVWNRPTFHFTKFTVLRFSVDVRN